MIDWNEDHEEEDKYIEMLREKLSKYPPELRKAFLDELGLDRDDSTPRPKRTIRELLAKYPPEIQKGLIDLFGVEEHVLGENSDLIYEPNDPYCDNLAQTDQESPHEVKPAIDDVVKGIAKRWFKGKAEWN
jgi:hypothetical protein